MNKKLIILTMGRILQMTIMFVTYRVLSNVLSVEDMGIYYFLLSISAGFGLIFANPLGMYANRMLHSWQDHGNLLRNLNALVGALMLGSLLTVPVLFLFGEKLSINQSSQMMVMLTLIFYVFSSSFNGSVVPALNLMGYFTSFVMLSFLTSLTGLVFSYLLVKMHPSEPLYWLIGQGIGFALFGLIALLLIASRSKINQKSNTVFLERAKRVWIFASPIVITNIAVWTLGQSFRFFYKGAVNPVELGELAFGLGLATSLAVAVEYLFHQLFFPDFYKKINEKDADKTLAWNNLFDRVMPSYLYVILFMFGLAPFIMRILADVKFMSASYYLALGVLIELLRMSGNVFNMATQSEMQTRKAIIPYVGGGVITLGGVLIISLNPEYLELTPFILMLGHAFSLVMLWKVVKKLLKFDLVYKHIARSFLISLLFLSAYFFHRYSQSLAMSLIVTVGYGLVLLALLYKEYRNPRIER